ncbi:multicopper oxidase family protein [Leucobacter sp. W1153]|uniref:multicopper oxidase family protein n=1 Tax=Leucobacter sp. W1153 TaxID=3439064 RepID=UPI003F385622
MSDGITRRQALTIGAVGAGVLAIGATGLVLSLQTPRPASNTERSPETPAPETPAEATVGGWAEPEVLSARDGLLEFDLRVTATEVVVAGSTVRMLTYNGTVPGPTLHLHPGDRLRVHLINDLDEVTNLHTHGLHVSAEGNSDNPFVHIAPGNSFDYEIDIPDDHPTGINWYHPHHHGLAADQVFGGMYGAIVVDTDDWSDGGSPRVVLVSDTTFVGGGVVAVNQAQRMMGRTGETLLTNGQVAPELRGLTGSAQRLLLINACASRYLDLSFAGFDATLQGTDSMPLAEPRSVDRVLLAPGNRADVTVTIPAAATELVAASFDRGRMGMGMMGGQSTAGADAVVLTALPDAAISAPRIRQNDTVAHPDLRTREPNGVRTITMSMGMGGGGGGGMQFVLDGREYSHDRVDQTVQLGTMEEWTIVNDSPMAHPFHLHIWPMQVIRESGSETSGIDLRDVVHVPEFSSVTVRINFDRFPGRTVYHCHILDHEDLGMMGIIEAS